VSVLKDRIATYGQNEPDLRVVGNNLGPMTRPTSRIAIMPGVSTYEDMQPLYTSDGDIIPATAPGEWGQLYRAGVMS
jgi:hypothetical protein